MKTSEEKQKWYQDLKTLIIEAFITELAKS